MGGFRFDTQNYILTEYFIEKEFMINGGTWSPMERSKLFWVFLHTPVLREAVRPF